MNERRAAWVGLFTGPAAWFAHQQLTHWLRPMACNGREALLPALAIGALLVLAFAFAWAARGLRAQGPHSSDLDRFLAILGALSPLAFGLAVAFQSWGVLAYGPCVR